MSEVASNRAVVVGIDGSKSALRAVRWAVEEALDRGVVLRLVHAIDCAKSDFDLALDDARAVLDGARAAVEETSRPVDLETEILQGDPVAALVESSRRAELMCLGAKGMHDSAPAHRGATGAMVAESALCPVIVVRRRGAGRDQSDRDRRIVAVLEETPISHGVLQAALDEAGRRSAPVLAVTSWPVPTPGGGQATSDAVGLRRKLDRYVQADDEDRIRVSVMTLPSNLTELLVQTPDLDQLVIVGMGDPDLITELVGPRARKLLRKTNCSVMVFRGLSLPTEHSHDERPPESARAS